MVLSPVTTIQVDVYKASVRGKVTHIEHGVVREPVGHVGAARPHIVGPTAEVHDVKAVGWGVVLVFKAIEEGVFDLGSSVLRSEADAEALLREIGVIPSEVLQACVFLESGPAVGKDHLNGGRRLAAYITATLILERTGIVGHD